MANKIKLKSCRIEIKQIFWRAESSSLGLVAAGSKNCETADSLRQDRQMLQIPVGL